MEGMERKDMPGEFGYPSPLSPPVGSSERKKEGKKLRSLEQMAKEALVAEAGRSDGAAAAAEAVTAVVALCGKRHNTLDEEFAPRLAAARGAVLAACPALQKKLDAYVERSKILAMHDARAQVLGGKLGAVAGAVAGLTPAQKVEFNEAVDLDNQPEIARLLALGAAASGKLAGVAGLTPAQRVEYDAAVASNNESEIARLLALGVAANAKKTRKTKGDIVSLELVQPAGDKNVRFSPSSTTQLEVSIQAHNPNTRKVMLNKDVCTDLGFGHLLDGKASRHFGVYLKFSPTDEIKITSKKLGTSLKPGWVGAELRAVLVSKAAVVAAKVDKEDEEVDA